jgi:hypothetical protein
MLRATNSGDASLLLFVISNPTAQLRSINACFWSLCFGRVAMDQVYVQGAESEEEGWKRDN